MNLLLTGAWQQATNYIDYIEETGHSVRFLQYEKDELPCDASWVEGIVGNGIFLTHPIEKFINLRYVQLTSAGFDRVPMQYIENHGIIIKNARGVYSIPMAEYALSGVLALYKKQRFFIKNQSECKWEKARDLKELYGQKISIFGCGSVGIECAKRFHAMGCDIYGIDPVVRENIYFNAIYDTNCIKEILTKTDVVIITLPLTDSTEHMFNSEIFSAMKDGAVVVNIARGALVDTDALIKALKTRLYGAVIDVFEEEPLKGDNPLWKMENVIITPHNSFVGNGNKERLSKVILDNLSIEGQGAVKK